MKITDEKNRKRKNAENCYRSKIIKGKDRKIQAIGMK